MSVAGTHEQKLGRSSPESAGLTEDETVAAIKNGTVVNASGYKDQLKRQYGLLGLSGIAITVDNAWIALGSSISVSIGMFSNHRIFFPPRAQPVPIGKLKGLRYDDIDDILLILVLITS